MNKNYTEQQAAFFATLKIEADNLNPIESRFAEKLATLVDTVPLIDCRILRNQVKAFAKELNLDMVIGCGGSHIWIHRASEFVNGDNANAENKRFAIITD